MTDFAAHAELTTTIAEAQRLMDENLIAMRTVRLYLTMCPPRVPAPVLGCCDFANEHNDCHQRATVHNVRAELDVCLYHHEHINHEIAHYRWDW